MSITIDSAMAKRLVDAAAIRGASIIGQPGGWSVLLKLGSQEKPLGVQRSDKPRIWRSLDSCVEYLKTDLNIARIDLLDATNFSKAELAGKSRPDAAARLKNAFAAVEHDQWFREQVEIALVEAGNPNTSWVSQEDADASWAAKRADLAKRSKGSAV
ncbi:MAG: hypothetical protein ABSB19_10390 [Methylomonas sp.]|jgi:hypothetical protein